MKTLKDHLILFDAECPMCGLYTKAFVYAGLLDKNGRAAYQRYPAEACPLLDRQRAVNEIALVNQQTGEVTYGIHSLLKVFGTAMPLFKPVFEFVPLVWLLSKVYAFISYNRRVIIPAAADSFEYQPTFKLHYRIAYLLFSWIVTAYILSAYVHLLTGLLPQGTAYREYLISGVQLLYQGVAVCLIARDKAWAYLGNMMTISLAGALALTPGILIAHWLHIGPLFYTIYFMAVAGMMFLEHIRRTRLLNLGWALSINWAAYRAAVLLIILLIK